VVGGVVERYGEAPLTRIREHAIVHAPPEEVWPIVSDPRNLPRWNRYVHAVHDVPPDELEEGDRYWTEMGGFGVRVRVRAEVVKIEPKRYSKIKLSGPIQAVVQTWVHPAGSRRSRLEHQVDYEFRGGPLGSVVGRILRHLGAAAMLRRGVRAQKRQIEGS
jgi:ligand-binding SRPBCC domain-containing protein